MNQFSILGHWKGDDFSYELQIKENDKITMYPFKSPLHKVESIKTLQAAKAAKCPCEEVGNIPGVSRLYGEFSEPIERDPSWLNFEGVAKDTKEVYMPIESGEVEIKKTENGAEFDFKSEKFSGRWLMRQLPNVFDNKFIQGENMQLFWKPDNKEANMTQKLENLKTMQSSLLKGGHQTLHALMQSGVSVNSATNEFEVTVAAEGTWTDKFGQKFTYTKDFINTLFTSMNMQVLDGLIPIGVDKEHSKVDEGKMTELQLLDEPIAHIKGRGFFNGPIGDVNGASIDAELDAVFLEQFQSWFPVNGITKRVSLVANPACKVCFFTPKASG